MKKLIWKLILPFTIISFVVFRKWWYVFPVDAPDSMMAGFPLPYVCDGWFTSMSNQFFVMELIIDLVVYFLFWSLLIFIINRFFLKIQVPKILMIFLMSISMLIVCCFIFIASMRENIFILKRDFDVEVKETGYNFIWQNTQRPDVKKYTRHEK
ncbi:hypothetical protein G4D82_09755 [Flavobacterium sp. CYK-4]|uniref:hypothetical protein n=1 Tax=Flavobacterium lotistagni TaxID=2709660 RepID=UPI0014072BCC|nr:hypothetical protein [Flavobacterium lotistagni]NHM07504.1 hypothetical protein [Flavobacterium lotistagni]